MSIGNGIYQGKHSALGNVSSPTATTLDSSGDKIAAMFIAPDGGQAITKIGVFCNTLTGTSPIWKVSLQGFNATGGEPDGTIKGGVSPASATFSAVSATYHEITLDNPYTPTQGEELSAVLEYDSGTIDGGNNASFHSSNTMVMSQGAPYALIDSTGSWAKIPSQVPMIAPIYADGYIVPNCICIIDDAATVFNTGSAPDEKGNLWTPPDNCTLVGVSLFGRVASAVTNWELIVYDSGDVELENITMDGELTSSSATNRQFTISFPEIAIMGGSEYRLAVKPTTVNNLRISELEFVNSAHRASVANDLQRTERTDAGVWTDTPGELTAIWPVLSATPPGGGLKLVGSGGLVG